MMMVSGPGQKAAISSWARSGTSLTRPGSISGPVTWTMRGYPAAPLGHKDIAHRRTVAGIGGNAVDRLSGQGYKLSLPQQLRGLGYACFIGRQNSGFDFHTNHRSFYL